MSTDTLGKILVEKDYCCICCMRYFKREETEIFENEICICEDCFKKINQYSSEAVLKLHNKIELLIVGFSYSGILRKAFMQYKFKNQKIYAHLFSRLLALKTADVIRKMDLNIMVPVPLSKERLKERGYNQAELIGKFFATDMIIPYSEKAIYRIRNTKRQSDLNTIERFENVKNAFAADKRIVFKKSILLFDDIYTSGATMNECAFELFRAGACKVVGLSLFRKELPEERKTKNLF